MYFPNELFATFHTSLFFIFTNFRCRSVTSK